MFIRVGGGLIPEPTPVEPPITGTLPLNYSDIVALRAEIVRHVTASLKKDLASFQKSLRSEVESHMEKHINKHIDKVHILYIVSTPNIFGGGGRVGGEGGEGGMKLVH